MSGISIIMCEGYPDRAFIAQWLEQSAKLSPQKGLGPTNLPARGSYSFAAALGRIAHVVPLGGVPEIYEKATDVVKNWVDRADRVLLIIDHDGDPAKAPTARRAEVLAAFRARLESRQLAVKAAGTDSLSVGSAEIRAGVWAANEQPAQDLPGREHLERLVAVALRQAFPKRFKAVHSFLEDRPDPVTPPTGKEPALTYAGAWHPDAFSEEFYRAVWREPSVAADLSARLRSVGVLDLLAWVAQDTP